MDFPEEHPASQGRSALHTLLRKSTSEAHSALDALVGDIVTPDDYRRYLAGMTRFRIPLEAQVTAVEPPKALGPWRPTLIAPSLLADQVDLGMTTEIGSDEGPLRTDFPSLVGTFYVTEGSNLGARLTLRRAGRLGFDATFGARHLTFQANALGNWHIFLNRLAQIGEIDRDLTVTAAQDAFMRAARAMSRQAN